MGTKAPVRREGARGPLPRASGCQTAFGVRRSWRRLNGMISTGVTKNSKGEIVFVRYLGSRGVITGSVISIIYENSRIGEGVGVREKVFREKS